MVFQLAGSENSVQNKQIAGWILFQLTMGTTLQKIVGCAWEIKVPTQFSIFIGWKEMASDLENHFVINSTHKLIWMQSMLRNALLIGEYTYLSGYFTANPQRALCALCRKHTPSTPKEQVHCEDTTLMYFWCQSAQNRTSSVSTSHGKGSKLTEVMLCGCVLANCKWPQ